MQKKILLSMLLLVSCAACAQKSGSTTNRGLYMYNYNKQELTVEQNGKVLALKGSQLPIGIPDYHHTYCVQNNLLVYQSYHNLFVVRFDERGNVLAEFEVDNENNADTGVALYGDIAITAGTIEDPSRITGWTYAIMYVNTTTQEVQNANILESFDERYAAKKFVAKAKGLSVAGDALYVLVEICDLKSSNTIGEYFIAEYDLKSKSNKAERITPINLMAKAIKKEMPKQEREAMSENTADSSLAPKLSVSPRLLEMPTNAVSPTYWGIAGFASSSKYVVVSMCASTLVYMGMSIGSMNSSSNAYLVYDRQSMQPVAFYPLTRNADPYSSIAVDGELIYSFDWNSCALYVFNMAKPEKQSPKDERSIAKQRRAINTYPTVGASVVKAGLAERVAAKGKKAYRSHFSISNNKLFYIAEDGSGEPSIASLRIAY